MLSSKDENDLFLTLYDRSGSNVFEPTNYKREEELALFIKENKGILLTPDEINNETTSKVKRTISNLEKIGFQLKGKMIAFRMNADHYLTTQELKILTELEQYLKDNNADLVIEAEDLFTLEEIIKTNEKLNAEIEYINSLTIPTENNRPLNEMEKFIMAYDFCTNFKYNENESNGKMSRYITSILNGNNIVCVGYAHLLYEMCNRLNIECHHVGVGCIDKKTKERGGHHNNIVIIDNKMYYADACWDCQRQGDKGLKLYNHCLIPMSDRNEILDCDIEYAKSNNLPKVREHLQKAVSCYKSLKSDEISYKDCRDFIINYYDVTNQPINDDELDDKKEKDWQKRYQILEKNRTLKKLEFLIKYLNKHQFGEAISYNTFEQALMNIYLAKGMSEKSAQSLLDRTMEINEKRAKKCFTDNATNCFVAGRTQDLEV